MTPEEFNKKMEEYAKDYKESGKPSALELMRKLEEKRKQNKEDVKNIRWIWRCVECKDVVISYSHLRHDMNYCDCGKTAVDLEEHYCRMVGKKPEVLSVKSLVDGKWVKIRD